MRLADMSSEEVELAVNCESALDRAGGLEAPGLDFKSCPWRETIFGMSSSISCSKVSYSVSTQPL